MKPGSRHHIHKRIETEQIDLAAHQVGDAGLGDAEPRYKDSYSSVDPEDADYVRVLEHINEFLPVTEFAGRIINVGVLRQFGLVENEQVDCFLATAFGKGDPTKSERALVPR